MADFPFVVMGSKKICDHWKKTSAYVVVFSSERETHSGSPKFHDSSREKSEPLRYKLCAAREIFAWLMLKKCCAIIAARSPAKHSESFYFLTQERLQRPGVQPEIRRSDDL